MARKVNGVKNEKRTLTVVVPALDAAPQLPRALAALAGRDVEEMPAPPPCPGLIRASTSCVQPCEIIVVDGGSRDATVAIARAHGARVIAAPPGRGAQLAVGIAAAAGDWLLLLHADTVMAPGWDGAAQAHMGYGTGRAAYFRFALDSADPRARRLERWVAWRCRALGLPYGDQGLLISRTLLDAVGGVRPLPLMEDVDLVRRIGRARLVALPVDAVTSAARWKQDGWRLRSLRNLACLALWFAGVPPRAIARLYG